MAIFVAVVILCVFSLFGGDTPYLSLIVAALIYLYWQQRRDIKDLRQNVDELLRAKSPLPHPQPETKTTSPQQPQQASATNPVASLDEEISWQQGEFTWPTWSLTAINWVKQYFTQGNTIVRVGALLLLIGIGFLLNYSIQHNHFTLHTRLVLILVSSIILLVIGLRLRHKKPNYAQILQGVALGMQYLTIYAASDYYYLIPLSLGFGLLVIVSSLTIALGLWQNSLSLALLSLFAGYLAPIILHIDNYFIGGFYLYYALLNCLILIVALKKSWRLVNLVGFGFTFIATATLGYFNNHAAQYTYAQTALIVYFIQYIIINILTTAKLPPSANKAIDNTLTFGPPIIGFAIQMYLVQRIPYAAAISSAAVSIFYLALAWVLTLHDKRIFHQLIRASIALGTLFFTLYFPLMLAVKWVYPAWALEGAVILWMGMRQHSHSAVGFGFVLLLIALGLAGFNWPGYFYPQSAFINPLFLSHLCLIIAAILSSYWLDKRRFANWQVYPSWFLFAAGILLAVFTGMDQVNHIDTELYRAHAQLGVLCVILSLLIIAKHALKTWNKLQLTPLINLIFTVILACYLEIHHVLLFVDYLVILWLINFCLHYLSLYQLRQQLSLTKANRLHLLSLLGITVATTLGLSQQAQLNGYYLLSISSWLFIPTGFLSVILVGYPYLRWPMQSNHYNHLPAYCLSLWLLNFGIMMNFLTSGHHTHFMPLLNLVDAAVVLSIACVIVWTYHNKAYIEQLLLPISSRVVMGLACFIALTGITLRSISYYFDIAYELNSLFYAPVAQTAISILWTIIALGLMYYAHFSQKRKPWQLGAALIAIVVLKLFIIDLAGHASIERIISFIAVGALLLLIGYIAPLPKETPQARDKNTRQK